MAGPGTRRARLTVLTSERLDADQLAPGQFRNRFSVPEYPRRADVPRVSSAAMSRFTISSSPSCSSRATARVLFAAVLVSALGACGSSSGSSATKTTATKSSAPSNGPIDLTKAVVRTLQTDLDAVNCNVGAHDGIFGPETFAGLQAFKKAENLPEPTIYNVATRTSLKAAVTAGAPVCPNPPSTSTTTSTLPPGNPPCTVAALSAALPADQVPAGTIAPQAFQCSGPYAYADVDIAAPASITVTNLFIATGDSWASIDRVQPCAGGSGNPIPAVIYDQACNSN